MKKFLLFFTLALTFAIFAAPSTSQAAEKSWKISNWDSKIAIQEDASFDVVDTVTFDFTGSFSFVTRSIDNQKFDSISDYVVTDEQGTVLGDSENIAYDASLDAYVNTINFSAVDQSRTFTFSYTINGGIGYFEDHDELYWNILPSDRDVPIEAAKIVVTLPEAVSESDMSVTAYSEGDDIVSAITSPGMFQYSGRNFGADSNFTIVAGWPIDVVYNPGIYRVTTNPKGATVTVDGFSALYETPLTLRTGYDLNTAGSTVKFEKFGYKTQEVTITPEVGARESLTYDLEMSWWLIPFYVMVFIYVLHPLAVFFVMLRHWHKKGRDPKGRSTIIAEYDAPDKLPPTLVGALIDEKVDLHEITASIIDLARRGYLKIRELPKKTFASQDFELIKLKSTDGDKDLYEYERLLLTHMFGSKQTVKLSGLKNKFFKFLPDIQKSVYKEIADRGYFVADPDKVRRKYTIIGIIVLVLGFFGVGYFAIGIPLVIDGIVILIFARVMPKRSPDGVLKTQAAMGFKEYLHTAERYRVQKLTPETFEKFLPYAMVFKIEKEWAKKFEGIYKGEPDWYESSSPHHFARGFIVGNFVSSLSSFNNVAATSFTTRPGGGGSGASGGGGGFSGGFSGGGGGGGGISAG